MSTSLAICGGPRTVPEGLIAPWPPTTPLDEEMVLRSLRGHKHAWGDNCEALQEEFARWNGNRYCLAVTSGTAALQMCIAACNLSAGDEVIVPAYSWTSSATAVLHQKCIPVFVDIEPRWANIDPDRIEAAITPRTRAIMVVHLHGVPADMDPILDIARRHDLMVIEDACQAHGSCYRNRRAGTIGHCAAFSLNQNKMLSAGEGGLFVTDDPQLLERARAMMLFGDFRKPLDDPDYHSYGMGWMIRYNDLCAAYARAQLRRIDDYIDRARRLFAVMRRELAEVRGLILPSEPAYATENGYNFVCHVDAAAMGYGGPPNFLREAVVSALSAEGVPAMVWQRRILPEMAAIAARNAYGRGSPWREHGSTVAYDPAGFPAALHHSGTYFIIGGLRYPNDEKLARLLAHGVRKVFENIGTIDIDDLARRADVSMYERGWKPRT